MAKEASLRHDLWLKNVAGYVVHLAEKQISLSCLKPRSYVTASVLSWRPRIGPESQ